MWSHNLVNKQLQFEGYFYRSDHLLYWTLPGECFNGDGFNDILMMVESIPFQSCAKARLTNQSLYLFGINDFATLLINKSKDWNLMARLWGSNTAHNVHYY